MRGIWRGHPARSHPAGQAGQCSDGRTSERSRRFKRTLVCSIAIDITTRDEPPVSEGKHTAVSTQPLLNDVVDFLALQRFVSEQVVNDRSQGGPVVVVAEQAVQRAGAVFEPLEPLTIIGDY